MQTAKQVRSHGAPVFTLPELLQLVREGQPGMARAGIWQACDTPEKMLALMDLYWADGKLKMPRAVRKAFNELLNELPLNALLDCQSSKTCSIKELLCLCRPTPRDSVRSRAFATILKRKVTSCPK